MPMNLADPLLSCLVDALAGGRKAELQSFGTEILYC